LSQMAGERKMELKNTNASSASMPGLSFSLDLALMEIEAEYELLDEEKTYDLLVIGAGPAGMNAALFAVRKGLQVGIIAKNFGGQVKDTTIVDNYLGIMNISGSELSNRFREHLDSFKIPMLRERYVTLIKQENNVFVVELENQQKYRSRTILIATGARPRKLGVPGEAKLIHKGVSYCSICDGPLFYGQEVAVIGGGDCAIESAIDLSRYVSRVTLVHRSTFRAEKILLERLEKLDNLDVKLGYVVEEIIGDKKVEGARIKNLSTGETEDLTLSGIMIEIGYTPNSQDFADLVETNQWAEIVVNEKQATSFPGIYAAGDVTSEPTKQIIVAAAAGAKASLAISEYLNKEK